MKSYEYKDYKHYKEEQIAANHRKLSWNFTGKSHIAEIKKRKSDASNIICHGTRRGGEQLEFLKFYPNAYVIGTEISDTATQFPNTVEHDFNVQKEEWIEKFDVIYSNAFDHSFDPNITIEVWKQQLAKYGIMYLAWPEKHNSKSTSVDPLSGKKDDFISFLQQHSLQVEVTGISELLECKL